MDGAVIGVDVGKDFHWAEGVSGARGAPDETLLSRHVDNTEEDIAALIEEATAGGRRPLWAVDMKDGPAALIVALLLAAGQEVVFVPGITVNRTRDSFPGESKTDAVDARVIAECARTRSGLSRFDQKTEAVVGMGVLCSHRRDLVADRTRATLRLRSTLSGISPALERALSPSSLAALTLLTRYQTPAAIRRAGVARIASFLKGRGRYKAEAVATAAHQAALSQSVRLPGESYAATVVASLAEDLLRLRVRIDEVDKEIEGCFFSHPQAETILSLPGMGPYLGAEFLARAGDLGAFAGPHKLAAYAGLAPRLVDSGKRSGNLRRARGGNKGLKYVFYQSAFASLSHPASRAFYDRKRAEGKRHHQAVLALARRRVDVLWAMLAKGERYRAEDATAA